MEINIASSNIARRTIPWYADEYMGPEQRNVKVKDYLSLTPQDIKAELERSVVGQEETCKRVAIMMYQHLHGHRSVQLLAGPTGSGKSHIAETLQKIFPDVVYLRDISNVTNDGWSGGKKVASLFHGVHNPVCYNGVIYPFMVLDECDKLFSPRTNSGGENVSESVQGEFLSVIQGGEVEYKEDKDKTICVNTRPMSFLFAGAFEKKAKALAEKESAATMGFGASYEKIHSYHRAFTMEDIQEAGCITELCGRIQTVISLKRFEEEHFLGMLEGGPAGPIAELEAEFNIRLLLSKAKKEELAHEAFVSGLGIRGMKNQLRYYIDEAIWEDCKTSHVEVS